MKQRQSNETNPTETAEQVINLDQSTNVVDFSTTLRELKRSVDQDRVRQRVSYRDRHGHAHFVEYVEWHTVADILDEMAPNWEHTVKSLFPIGDIMTVTVAVTIDGVTREGIGTGSAVSETGIKKAEHDALKRAAVKFGIARELYKREFDSIESGETASFAASNETSEITEPIARSLGDMVTAKQLGMIRAIARESGLDAEAECSTKFQCRVDELSKRAASDLIEHLQFMQRKAGMAFPMRRAG